MKRILSVFALLLISATFSQAVYAQASCSVFGSSASLNNGQTRTYSATTQGGASYFWSVTGPLTIVGSNTGSSVVVRGNGSGTGRVCYARYRTGQLPCAACRTVTVVNNNPNCPSTLLILGSIPECLGLANLFEVNLSVSSAYSNYNWSVSGGGASIIGSSTGNSITVFASGNFTVSVSAICNGQTISGSRGVNAPNCDGIIPRDIRLSPNPTSEQVTIDIDEPKSKGITYVVEIFDSMGNKEASQKVQNHQSIDVSKLKKGIHYLRVYGNGQVLKMNRIVIE
ncbi:MAG TPA: hypothetical protein DCS93_12915 [Microscillaceae bacterium]|nr:hypothetical protein [Microscillaceae bacterium]